MQLSGLVEEDKIILKKDQSFLKEERENIEEVIEKRIQIFVYRLLEEKGLNLNDIEKIRHSGSSEV